MSGTLEADTRKALLQRLADDIALISSPDVRWTCCWLDFRHDGKDWAWALCGGWQLGELPMAGWPCPHWHHRHEVFMAIG